jgi:NADPH:quinone reductase-like Zn-dependent oxidoreductase
MIPMKGHQSARKGDAVKAVVQRAFGLAGGLELSDVDKPTVPDDGVLVRVRASSVNPAEWYAVMGRPYVARPAMGLRTPKQAVPGADFAGTVEAVGGAVTGLRPGDALFGGSSGGCFAEYVCVRATVAPKPANLTFEQAAAVPTAAFTALQGLRDKGRIQPGQKVLVNGASGGVGTFAVQLAKAFGAEVTGVCSTSKVELVRSLGADHVIDYTDKGFAGGDRKFDLVIDIGGDNPVSRLRRTLKPRGRLVIVGGEGDRWTGVHRQLWASLMSLFVRQKLGTFIVKENARDLQFLNELIEAGKVKPVIDRTYPLDAAPDAVRYFESGRATGRIALVV